MPRVLFQPQVSTPTPISNRIGLYAKENVIEDRLVYQTDDGVEHVVLKNPMTTSQDLIVAGTDGIPSRLGRGSEGQVLKIVSSSVAWAADSSGLSNPMSASGDMIYAGSAGVPTRLAKGSDGQVLKLASGVPTWATDSTGMENPMTTSQDIIVGGSSGTAGRLGKGSDGQVLKMVSGSVAWSADAGGMENPMSASGDIILGGTSGSPTRLPVGTEDQVLKVVSGVPAWGTASGGINWVSATSAVNAVNKYGYLLNSTSASFTVTLPSSPTVGNEIGFLDVGGICTTKPVTVARNGNLIQGLAEDLVIDFDNAAFSLVYSSTGWRVNNFIKGIKGEQGNPGFGGMWELVERWEPSAPATSHTFSGLNGDVDKRYKAVIHLRPANNQTGQINLRFNSDSAANYAYKWWDAGSPNGGANSSATACQFGYVDSTSAAVIDSVAEIFAVTGTIRTVMFIGNQFTATDIPTTSRNASIWKNTSSNITSIEVSFGTNGIAVGSYIELWKLSSGNTQSLDFGGAL